MNVFCMCFGAVDHGVQFVGLECPFFRGRTTPRMEKTEVRSHGNTHRHACCVYRHACCVWVHHHRRPCYVCDTMAWALGRWSRDTSRRSQVDKRVDRFTILQHVQDKRLHPQSALQTQVNAYQPYKRLVCRLTPIVADVHAHALYVLGLRVTLHHPTRQ